MPKDFMAIIMAYTGDYKASTPCGLRIGDRRSAPSRAHVNAASLRHSSLLHLPHHLPATLIDIVSPPASPASAKINISYSILFNLTTSYSSYFGGKKGISRNKTSFFLLMLSGTLSSWLLSPLSLLLKGGHATDEVAVDPYPPRALPASDSLAQLREL